MGLSTRFSQSGRRNGALPHDAAVSRSCQRLETQGELHACREAMRVGRVTFHDVATAWFAMCDHTLSEQERAAFADLYPTLREEFARPRGGIVTAYFCRQLRVAAALTSSDRAARNPEGVITGRDESQPQSTPEQPKPDRSRRDRLRSLVNVVVHGQLLSPPRASSSAIHIESLFGDPEEWEAKTVLFKCKELHDRALEYLIPKPRNICMRKIFGVITALLGSLDSQRLAAGASRGARLSPAALAALHHELQDACRYLDRSMQRQAQLEYFVGMLWGWGAVVAAFGLFVLGSVLAGSMDLVDEPLMLSALAGGLGAVVSVMQRMTSGRLRLVAEDGKRAIRILGGIRPVLGAILGVVLYVLLGGGLLPFEKEPPGVEHLQYYVVGLAFIAGFSERFAQDMITGAAGGVQAGSRVTAAPREPVSEAERAYA